MAVVVVAGIGLAALHNPTRLWASALFTLAVALPLGAVLVAMSCQGKARLPWIGFALFGLFFLNVSFNLARSHLSPSGYAPIPDTIPVRGLVELTPIINPEVGKLIDADESISAPTLGASRQRGYYFNCCSSLGAIFFAFLGGLFGHWLEKRHPEPPNQEE
jgi:hypothetical protein